MKYIFVCASLFASLCFSTVASATLYDRGEGLIYDDVLDITWLFDANYANTSGTAVSPDTYGRMTWDNAMTWVDDLVYAGYDDWRLPTASNAYGINEMYYMFYENLDGALGDAISETHNAYYNWFENIQDKSYASGTEYSSSSIYDFNFNTGKISTPGKDTWFYAWAVRDGDCVPVPEPDTLLLMGTGLIGFAGIFRKKIK